MKDTPIQVLVWDENPPHCPRDVYPRGIRGAIAEGLSASGRDELVVRTANLDDPEQGLSAAALAQTDTLLWWGHIRHREVTDETIARVAERVLRRGMGLIALHSAHYSKALKTILNCTGHLKGGWSEADQPEEIRVCAPQHPIAHGIHDFTLAREEMYGAPFDVPPAAAVILQSYFPTTNRFFPSGLAWSAGNGIDQSFESGPGNAINQGEGVGRVFYFRPGHETAPTYFNSDVQRILLNAVRWTAGRS